MSNSAGREGTVRGRWVFLARPFRAREGPPGSRRPKPSPLEPGPEGRPVRPRGTLPLGLIPAISRVPARPAQPGRRSARHSSEGRSAGSRTIVSEVPSKPGRITLAAPFFTRCRWVRIMSPCRRRICGSGAAPNSRSSLPRFLRTARRASSKAFVHREGVSTAAAPAVCRTSLMASRSDPDVRCPYPGSSAGYGWSPHSHLSV